MNTNTLLDWITNMTIAAYIHPDPDKQVRRMAIKYKLQTLDKNTHNSLNAVINNPSPSSVIIRAYDELISIG